MNESGEALESLKSCAEIHAAGQGGLVVKTPSTCSNASSIISPNELDLQNELGSETINLIAAHLESYKTSLNSGKLEQQLQISSRLLYDSTAGLITPASSQLTPNSIRIFLLDKSFCFHSMLLLPFRFLLLNRRLDPTLREAAVNAVCELVEMSGGRLKSSWKFLFACLSRLEISFGYASPKKQRQRHQQQQRVMNKNISRMSVSSDSPFTSSSSSEQSTTNSDDNEDEHASSSSSSSDQALNLSFSTLSCRFDSARTLMSSLTHIFNTYLSLAAASDFVLASGAFEFLRCISLFLRKQSVVKFDDHAAPWHTLFLESDQFNQPEDISDYCKDKGRFLFMTIRLCFAL